MWNVVRRVSIAIGSIFMVLGLVDIPDQFNRWRQLISEIGMTGETGRWVLVVAGLVIIFISSDIHRKLSPRKKTAAEILYPDQPWYKKLVPWQSVGRSSSAKMAALMEIKYENVLGKRFYTWEIEIEDGQKVSVQRCSILLENKSDHDFKNVSVKLTRAISLGAREQALPADYLGYDLRLDQQATTLRAGDKVWVPLISYRKSIAPAWISIEGVDQRTTSKEGKLFDPDDGYELHVVVRTDDGVGAASFVARVEGGQLTMTQSSPATPTVPNQLHER